LRIVDAGDSEDAAQISTSNDILGKIKHKATVTSKPNETVDPTTGEITKTPKAAVQSTNLKSMLAGLQGSKR
jgi:hypothetical protein